MGKSRRRDGEFEDDRRFDEREEARKRKNERREMKEEVIPLRVEFVKRKK